MPEPGKSYRIKLPKREANPIVARERWVRNFFAKAGFSKVPGYAWRRKQLGLPKTIDNVLFVCVGNKARSFAAAQVLKRKTNELGLAVEVDSVGLSATPGQSANAIARNYLEKRGFSPVELDAHRSKHWLSTAGLGLLAKAAQSGIIITVGPGIKQAMQETLRGAEYTDWANHAASAGKRMYTLRGLVTGKEHWTWNPKKTGRLLSLDTDVAPQEFREQSPQEAEFLVHELIHVLGPCLQRKK